MAKYRNPQQYDMKPVSSGGGSAASPIFSATQLPSLVKKGLNVRFDSGFSMEDIQPWMNVFAWTTGNWSCDFYVFIWDTREVVAHGTISKGGRRSSTTLFCWATLNKIIRPVPDPGTPLKGKVDQSVFDKLALKSFDSSTYYVKYGDDKSKRTFAKYVVDKCRKDDEYNKLCPSDIKRAAWQIVKEDEDAKRKHDEDMFK